MNSRESGPGADPADGYSLGAAAGSIAATVRASAAALVDRDRRPVTLAASEGARLVRQRVGFANRMVDTAMLIASR